jgi:hypothetical protein
MIGGMSVIYWGQRDVRIKSQASHKRKFPATFFCDLCVLCGKTSGSVSITICGSAAILAIFVVGR